MLRGRGMHAPVPSGRIRWPGAACDRAVRPGPGGVGSMFIQTEQTPNPATLKFLPGRDVMARACSTLPTRSGPKARRWRAGCSRSMA